VTAQSEASKSVQHAWSVIRRWWLLIAIGTLIALTVGAAASLGSATHYRARAQVLFIQPGQALRPGQEAAVNRLSQLMDTVGQLATSDEVLEAARQKAAGASGGSGTTVVPRSLDYVRSRTTATPRQGSLILEIQADFPSAAEAQQVASAVIDQLRVRLGRLANSSADPLTQLTLEDVRAPVVTKVEPTVVRTLLIAFVLGAGFSVLAAFALDRS
jgi:capsular polysaccharide biosynthesis protein